MESAYSCETLVAKTTSVSVFEDEKTEKPRQSQVLVSVELLK